MPTLTRDYRRCIFKAEVIQSALELVEKMSEDKVNALPEKEANERRKYSRDSKSNSLTKETDKWNHDSFEEFFADYRKGLNHASLRRTVNFFEIGVTVYGETMGTYTSVTVEADSRAEVEKIFDVFDRHAPASFIEEKKPDVKPPPPPVVFIGHGGSADWRDLKDHLQDKHKYSVQAYEVGTRAGHTIRDILDEMLSKSSFALLVMTAEDETATVTFNPRLNVVHELGLFQGKLGFSRAIVLLEDGTEEFSNIHGIQQIRFAKGRIRETFGEVLATLKREFP